MSNTPDKIPGSFPRKAPTNTGVVPVLDTVHSTNPFYSSAQWQKLRKMVLKQEPKCRLCDKQAKCVDHINNITEDNRRCNLQPLCNSCHDWKTKTFDQQPDTGLAGITKLVQLIRFVDEEIVNSGDPVKVNRFLASIMTSREELPNVCPTQFDMDRVANLLLNAVEDFVSERHPSTLLGEAMNKPKYCMFTDEESSVIRSQTLDGNPIDCINALYLYWSKHPLMGQHWLTYLQYTYLKANHAIQVQPDV